MPNASSSGTLWQDRDHLPVKRSALNPQRLRTMMRPAFVLPLGLLFAMSIQAISQRNTVTLEALRDRQRVLLVFSNGDSQMTQAQLAVAAEHAAGFRERDLVLVGITGTNPAAPTVVLSAAADRAARNRFHIKAGKFTVILLGKDGGEKLRSHDPVTWETLQTTIDAMPMRKDEMKLR